jgi:hypothetical protein
MKQDVFGCCVLSFQLHESLLKENDDGADFLELSQQKFSESNVGDGHGRVRWSHLVLCSSKKHVSQVNYIVQSEYNKLAKSCRQIGRATPTCFGNRHEQIQIL